MTLLLPLVGFIFISLLVVAGAMALAPSGGTALQRRLGEVASARTDLNDEPPPDRSVIQAVLVPARRARCPSGTHALTPSYQRATPLKRAGRTPTTVRAAPLR